MKIRFKMPNRDIMNINIQSEKLTQLLCDEISETIQSRIDGVLGSATSPCRVCGTWVRFPPPSPKEK